MAISTIDQTGLANPLSLNSPTISSGPLTMQDATAMYTSPLGGGFASQTNPFADNSQILYATLNGSAVDAMGNYTFTTTGTVPYASVGNKFGYTSPTLGAGSNWLKTTTNLAISGSSARTFCCWVKSSTLSQPVDPAGVMAIGPDSSAGIVFSLVAHIAGTNQWGIWGFSADINTGWIVDTNWHFIAGTYDGNQAIFYLDGQRSGAVLAYNTTATPLYIGTVNNSGSRYFNGYVNSARVFNRALQPYEIMQLMLYGK